MILYLVITAFVTALYAFLCARFAQVWKSTKAWITPTNYSSSHFVSVLICARNEEKNIGSCLRSITRQKYPESMFEIILLDNHSTDQTVSVANDLLIPNLRVIMLSEMFKEEEIFKKEALSHGVHLAKGEWILVTDADCQVPENWMCSMLSYADKKDYQMVSGPAKIVENSSLLSRYQQVDFGGLIVSTAAGLTTGWLLSANAANMVFSRHAFLSVNGNSHSQAFASGDDIFLLQRLYQTQPNSVGFLKSKEAIVLTSAQPSLSEFLNQRKRWASKSAFLPHKLTKLVSTLVLLNACLLASHLLLTLLLDMSFLLIFAGHLLAKALSDSLLLREARLFFDLRQNLIQWIYNLVFNPLYILWTGISVTLTPKFIWKGRMTR